MPVAKRGSAESAPRGYRLLRRRPRRRAPTPSGEPPFQTLEMTILLAAQEAVQFTGGNIALAADLLGISRMRLYRILSPIRRRSGTSRR